ncbi:MAG: ubiquinol-cytochrome c reductase iron-sulfur subunit, partial [Acidimicrobiia bacterium]
AYTTLGTRREKELHAALPVPTPDPGLEGAQPVEGAPGYVREIPAGVRLRGRRPEEDVNQMSRRQFLNRTWVGGMLVFLGQFTLASVDFLYPRRVTGFGAKITVDIQGLTDADEIKSRLLSSRTPEFISDGRFWLMAFEGDAKRAAGVDALAKAGAVETGIVAMYRKCPHLGCSVPWCAPAKWFECPCHGSKYSINGEYRDGPAPRGLDRFPVEIKGGKIVVDTAQRIEGPPRGVVTSQPQPEGEHCVQFAAE